MAVFGLFFVLLILALSVGIPVIIGMIVYRDAKSRGMEAMVWALIAALVPSFVGIIIYLVIRRDYSLYLCRNCGQRVELNYHTCPHCGTALQLKCPECGSPVQYHWKACTKCGAAQPADRGPTIVTAPPANNKKLWALLICLIVLPIILLVMLLVASISFGSSYMVEDMLWRLSPDYWF